jgi:putative DNA primase/helicase
MDAELKKWCPKDATGQVQRVARRFLLCAAAGELATRWGILPWAEGEALAGIKKCFDAWVESRGGVASEAHEDAAAIRQVTLFLEKHGASRFHDLDDDASPSRIVERAGLRALKDNQTVYYVLPEVFRAEVCKGLNLKRAIEVLKERGMLWKGDGRNVMRKSHKNLPEFANRRFYALIAPGVEDAEPIPTLPTSNSSCRNGEPSETNGVSDTSDNSDTKTHDGKKNDFPDVVKV